MNEEQIEYWNEVGGPKWVEMQEALDTQLALFTRLVLDALGGIHGSRILDIGCGCGGSSLEFGRAVGDAGGVLGVDVSEPMLARARERAEAAGLGAVQFARADAQTHAFEEGAFDVLTSRFGVMFFEDPVAAFRNLRRALRPGGRLAFVCWRPLPENPWMGVPLAAAAPLVEMPPPPEPGAPGPFSLADEERLRGILDEAGFSDVALDAPEIDARVGPHVELDATVEFVLTLGPLTRILQEADEETRARVRDAVREAMAPYLTDDGVIMRFAPWLVQARAGA